MSTLRRSLMGLVCAAAAASPLSAQSATETPFTMHGFVTQGFGASDSLAVMGIPTTGTTDYRAAALQGRYRVDSVSTVVMQISHRRVGTSALATLEPALELDWAFYRRRFGPVTVSAGRIPMPRGFYNEVRDVGTLLPFFRAPTTIYPDGTEAVDGVAATTRMDLGDWSVEANAYAGGMEMKGVTEVGETMTAFAYRSERNIGAQLWVGTPIRGVRVGASYLNIDDESAPTGRNAVWIGSAEIDRDRWMLRSEVTDLTVAGLDITAGYVHGRFKITPKLHVMGQYEQSDMGMTVPMAFDWTEMKDGALGVAFAPSTHVVFKLEAHRAEGYGFDVPMDRFASPATSNYGLLSMSVSF